MDETIIYTENRFEAVRWGDIRDAVWLDRSNISPDIMKPLDDDIESIMRYLEK